MKQAIFEFSNQVRCKQGCVAVEDGRGQSFFIFRFTDPPDPFFWKLKKKRDYFQFYFFISLRPMRVQYWSSVMFFRFVLAARLIKLPPVTAPGEILPF